MTLADRIEKGKPYATGFVLGLIAAPIVAFGAGWVSTSAARAAAVEEARIETLASVCSSAAQRSWAAQSMEVADLKGYKNREKRDELVGITLAEISVPGPLLKKVSAGCSKALSV